MNNANTSVLGSSEDILQSFDRLDWRAKVTAALVDLAEEPFATTDQRASASKMLCGLANGNIIPATLPDGRQVRDLLAATCLSTLRGTPEKVPAEKLQAHRLNVNERLAGVQFTLGNVLPHLPEAQAEMSRAAGQILGHLLSPQGDGGAEN